MPRAHANHHKPALIFVWVTFGPYHRDRLTAVAQDFGTEYDIIGIEIASFENTYKWDRDTRAEGYKHQTLFPHRTYEDVPRLARFAALSRALRRRGIRAAFLCHYEEPEVFACSILLRLMGVPTYVMQESKFNDKPRSLIRELLKSVLYAPYAGGLVGTPSTRDYLRMLGVPNHRLHFGYDTVSVDRIRTAAGLPPAPDGCDFSARHFTIVARLVPKKNIATAIHAYALYKAEKGETARELHICGDGPLGETIRSDAARRGLTGVIFHGHQSACGVAKILATTLALVLPSTEEQFGLVVAEALAMGVPILCSDQVGGRELLVRSGVNGFIFEPDNPQGLARFFSLLDRDEALWKELAEASLARAYLGDVSTFTAGVHRILADLPALGLCDIPRTIGPYGHQGS